MKKQGRARRFFTMRPKQIYAHDWTIQNDARKTDTNNQAE